MAPAGPVGGAQDRGAQGHAGPRVAAGRPTPRRRARTPEARNALKSLLLKSLSPQRRAAYDYIAARAPEKVSATELSEHLCCALNHAGNIMIYLYKCGLLKRYLVDDESGARGRYEYTPAPNWWS